MQHSPKEKSLHLGGEDRETGGMNGRGSLPPEGKSTIPFRVWSKDCPLFPILTGDTIQIPDHKTVSYSEFAGQLLVAFKPASQAVHEAEVPLLESQDGYVSRSSH